MLKATEQNFQKVKTETTETFFKFLVNQKLSVSPFIYSFLISYYLTEQNTQN